MSARELAKSEFQRRNKEWLRNGHSATICIHGKARVWSGVSTPGEQLPPIEFCGICDYHKAVPLEVTP